MVGENKLRIGVVIPTYNRAHLITQALDCVRQQHLRPSEVIIIDDGSHDQTEQVVKEWQALWVTELAVSYQRQLNQGPGAARNRGVAYLTDCDAIAFLDSDDLWPVDHLAELSAYMQANPDAVACSRPFKETVFSAHGEMLAERLLSMELAPQLQGPLAIMASMPGTSATLVKRATFLAVGGFDEKMRYAEDRLLFMKIACQGRWGHLGGTPVIYRNQVKSATSDQLSNKPHQNSRICYVHRLDRALAQHVGQSSPWTAGANVALWKAWHRAGRHFDQQKKYKTAARYYARAFYYQRVGKSLGRMLAACIKSFLQ